MATLTKAAPSLIFGVGNWNNEPANLEKQQEMLAICRKYGVKVFDTARQYVNPLPPQCNYQTDEVMNRDMENQRNSWEVLD